MSRLWVVSYDISDNRRRARLATILEGRGERVQRSIFHCRLGIAEAMALRKSINEQMELEENDSIRWYPLCAWCEERARNLGISEPADRGDYYLV